MWVLILSIAWSKPIQVGSEGYSLRRALDVAQPGDVIEIVEHQSNVCVDVAKDIKIIAREAIRLQGKKGCKYMFTVTQGTFELTSVNLSNTDSGGVYVVGNTAKVILDRVRFEGLGNKKAKTSALYLDGSEAALKDSVFLSNQGSYGSAIQLRKKAVARIQGTRFEDNASQVGGAIYATEGANLVLKSSQFVKNKVISGGMGGALSLRDDSNVSIQDSLFEENSSQGKGGAIYAQQSRRQGYLSLTVSNSRFLSNHAPVGAGTGGALYARGQSRISIRDSVIQNNDASSHAGGIFLYDIGGAVDLQNTSFVGNRSRTGAGGAIYAASRNESGTVELNVRGGSFTENESAVYGGALSIGMKENPFGSLFLDNVLFEKNIAGSSRTGVGGAVHAYFNRQGKLRVQKSRFLSNRAELTGGALYAYGLLNLDIQGSTFWNNAAKGPSNVLERFGGAVFVDSSKQIRILQNRFCNNVSLSKDKNAVEAHGGAIYLQKSDVFTLENNLFRYNEARNGGGALATAQIGRVDLIQNTFVHNLAQEGAIWLDQSPGKVSKSIIAFQEKGGGVWSNAPLQVDGNVWYKNRGSDWNQNLPQGELRFDPKLKENPKRRCGEIILRDDSAILQNDMGVGAQPE